MASPGGSGRSGFPIHGKSAGCRQTIFSLMEVDTGLRMPCRTEVQPPLQTAGDSFSADYRRGCGRHALLQSSPDGERPVLSFIPANPILYRGSGKGFWLSKDAIQPLSSGAGKASDAVAGCLSSCFPKRSDPFRLSRLARRAARADDPAHFRRRRRCSTTMPAMTTGRDSICALVKLRVS